MGSRPMAVATSGAPSAAQQNAMARQALIKGSINRFQLVKTFSAVAPGAVLAITPLFVGLLKRFIVVVNGTLNSTVASHAVNLTDIGLANLLSNVVFTDTQNFVRVQTSGWHLDMVHRARHRKGLGEGLLSTALNESGNYGNNYEVIQAPTDVINTSVPFQMVFEIPVAYSDEDLRGGVFLGVVNATSQLNLTLNPQPISANGADSTLAVWKLADGSAAGNISAVTVSVYQEYLDQLPRSKTGALILPQLDLSTIYEVKNTAFGPFVQGQDNLMPYANFRDFLSAFLIYDHDLSADDGRPTGPAGSDVNYITVRSANLSDLVKYPPTLIAMKTKDLLNYDLPPGVYYLGSRRQPISTLNYGNMSIVLNPSLASSTNACYVGYEDFALANVLSQASQLGLA